MSEHPPTPPLVDPTENVLQLVNAAVQRLDDLRISADQRMTDIMTLRADYTKQLAEKESDRLNAIRAVDVNAVAVASERATAQATVLANQVVVSADALRVLVATTATTIATQLQYLSTQLTDRLSLLEKSQYENKGKTGGMRDVWGWIIAAVMALIAVASIVVPRMK